MKEFFDKVNQVSLVKQILVGLIVGVVLATTVPEFAKVFTILGTIFVGALKAVAPILVLFLVMAAISGHKSGQQTNMKDIIVMYLMGTFLAGAVAVILSFMFPIQIALSTATEGLAAPQGILEVLKTLLLKLVDNPINAIYSANYLGILVWAIVLGILFRNATDSTKSLIVDFSDAISKLVTWVIKLAPLGIMGLVIDSITTSGLDALLGYSKLLFLLVGCMLLVAFVMNPFIAYMYMKRNPYPLVMKCIKESGVTAFFTRSSAANIPVNMKLCEELELDKDTYSVSIPLGATINMAGATITITILTMAAVHTLGIEVNFLTAILLCVLSAASACGASGVAGGSLLLIPLSCSLFSIPDDIAMQVVGVGFIIGVLQDSFETALNSSTDVVFTAAAEYHQQQK